MALTSATFSAATINIGNKISLPDFCAKLRELGLPSSNSWAKTISQLQQIIDSPKANAADLANLEILVSWVCEYLTTFSKAISIYELGVHKHPYIPTFGPALLSGLITAGVEQIHPAGDFPALAGKIECGSIVERYFIRAVALTADHFSVVITTVSEYYVREKITLTNADNRAVAKLSDYSEIIGVRKVAFEHVDVIRFSHGVTGAGVVSAEIILDISRPGATALNQDEISKRFKKYESIVNIALASAVPGVPLPSSMNFFAAMERIYNSKDGNVCELGFATTLGGSVKKEKMKRNTADLRVETWHAGGRDAIAKAAIPDTIDIYRLSVSWKIIMSDDQPILSIPGSYKALSTGDVRHAIILGCTENVSFDFAFSRLLAFAK
ncbi:hypothetical protein [Pseudomonas migulae]|uniref:Uncharacterized protein n=1 Tax=Pseudomonas migulae TaxID=78543 RepID=A0ABY8N0C8_9PSED|nr:hypothetical protein [Pseudomonas migulae]WGK91722.1 hypothetical protein MOQ58_05895 [Pseudomonas migulae]